MVEINEGDLEKLFAELAGFVPQELEEGEFTKRMFKQWVENERGKKLTDRVLVGSLQRAERAGTIIRMEGKKRCPVNDRLERYYRFT